MNGDIAQAHCINGISMTSPAGQSRVLIGLFGSSMLKISSREVLLNALKSFEDRSAWTIVHRDQLRAMIDIGKRAIQPSASMTLSGPKEAMSASSSYSSSMGALVTKRLLS